MFRERSKTFDGSQRYVPVMFMANGEKGWSRRGDCKFFFLDFGAIADGGAV